MIERHQDYQLSIPTLPVGGLQGVTLQLDSDAPFAMRLVKTRNMPTTGFRFRSPRGVYIDNGYENALSTRGTVLYPQMVYGANAQINVDVPNTTGAPVSNVRILFRGSKLFKDGQIDAPTYPAKCSLFPFVYPVVVASVPIATGAQFNNQQLQIASDSDFALRYAFVDPFHVVPFGTLMVGAPWGNYDELYITLRDANYKAYSNEPIHADDLFGSLNPVSADSAPASLFPGLFTPEIYIPRSGCLYFDVTRRDTNPPYAANQICDLHFRFGGAKVFSR
jgi:hypothetical protein